MQPTIAQMIYTLRMALQCRLEEYIYRFRYNLGNRFAQTRASALLLLCSLILLLRMFVYRYALSLGKP